MIIALALLVNSVYHYGRVRQSRIQWSQVAHDDVNILLCNKNDVIIYSWLHPTLTMPQLHILLDSTSLYPAVPWVYCWILLYSAQVYNNSTWFSLHSTPLVHGSNRFYFHPTWLILTLQWLNITGFYIHLSHSIVTHLHSTLTYFSLPWFWVRYHGVKSHRM